MYAKLPINALEVRLDGTYCDNELLRDLPGGGSLSNQSQHLKLTLTQGYEWQLVPVRPPLLGEQCYMLNCSQCFQRGSLSVGESCHAADIQALVGSLASECAQAPPCPRLP